MNTIVSAFISNINERYSDSLKRYYTLGKILLKTNVPKIIYVDEIMFDLIGDDYNNSNTLIVKINKKKSYLYDYARYLTNFDLKTDEPTKDTIEYIFTMCRKTEWIREAILLNYFKTDNFIWIDFGIKHIFNGLFSYCSDKEFIEKINNLKYKTYNSVRIGGMWNLSYDYNIDIYKDIAWYFSGGIFGGNKHYLIRFADLMKSKCINIMIIKNTIMWEVNIWYLIYLENNTLFDSYGCSHDKSLIDNY